MIQTHGLPSITIPGLLPAVVVPLAIRIGVAAELLLWLDNRLEWEIQPGAGKYTLADPSPQPVGKGLVVDVASRVRVPDWSPANDDYGLYVG